MLLRVVLQVVDEGQVELDLANQSVLEDSLRKDLDQDLGLLELGNALLHELNENVAVEVDNSGASDIFDLFTSLFGGLHLDLAQDVHGVLAVDIQVLRLLDQQMERVVARLHLANLFGSLLLVLLRFLLPGRRCLSVSFCFCHLEFTSGSDTQSESFSFVCFVI